MKKLFIGILILLFFLMGCNAEDEYEAPVYKGQDLTIGVIGEKPDVREKNVHFQSVSLDELESANNRISDNFDTIFIMKENLEQAAENKYAKVYKELKLPIFFIESKKAYVPFINDDLTYNEVPDIDDQMYITGIISKGEDTFKIWGFGLYNDTENDTNIKSVYSSVFETIESAGL
ncbi:MAG TPA: hypothetical protein VNM69_11790 [Bacillus sp. (in: firmicutes)]|uniref:hypothetical protein n=1 Tax=Bacillus litorisediminis TaxID=2922713 RepID=UPI001FAEA33E|nr:hypothetical protein [Bacillus litorisediminis]HWO76559.1 hypothetical protein [Bacillus sp. (in: firmicutes)]